MAPVNRLNPEAGDVPLPDDPREIEAALRAGRISWRLVPYYRWRYGERGAAFTRSDSAWLVTLCQFSEPHARGQVEWLGSVLSNRGMPRWLLELHLEVLHRELTRAVPERAAPYQILLALARELRTARFETIAEERFERLARDFAAGVGAPTHRWMMKTGYLLVAAVADEKAGMPRPVGQLVDWLTDPARFAEVHERPLPRSLRDVAETLSADAWPEAVRLTVDEARRA